MANQPAYIIFHTIAAKGNHDISDIEAWHRARGFRTVGYHYYIRRSGQLQTGRKEDEVGAHCIYQGMNRKSIGISFEGHGDFEGWTNHQTLTFLGLVKTILNKYEAISVDTILGHRETGSPKTCPGTLIDCEKVRSLIRHYLHLN